MATALDAVRLRGGDASPRGEAATSLRAVKLAIVAAVLLQRFGLPLGDEQLSMVLPVVAIGGIALVARRQLVEDRTRLSAYLVALGLCLVSTLVAVMGGADASLLSVGQLVLLYLPFSFVLAPSARRHYREVCEFFCGLMVVFAAIGLAQWAAQQFGWTFEDPIADLVSEDWVLQGFNTFYPVDYGSPIVKPNAVVFLEPSFLSQAVGLAFVVQLLLGGNRRRLLVYAGCMLATVAGTGVLLVGVGVILLLLAGGTRRVRLLTAPVVLAVLVLAFSPAGALFSERSAEGGDRDSSAYARFYAPNDVLVEELTERPMSLLLGRGPGAAEVEAERYEERTGVPIVFPVLPKLVLEYGLLAAVAFVAFLLVCLVSGVPSVVVGGSLLFMSLALSGALLQPSTVLLCWLLSSVFATEQLGQDVPAGARVRAAKGRLPGGLPSPA